MIHLEFLDLDLSICRLDPGSPVPTWVEAARFCAITRTVEELSIVCESSALPPEPDFPVETGWSVFRVAGTLDFALTGVISSITTPLADAGISVFAVSTFDTDYLLIRSGDVSRAKQILAASFRISDK